MSYRRLCTSTAATVSGSNASEALLGLRQGCDAGGNIPKHVACLGTCFSAFRDNDPYRPDSDSESRTQ